MTLFLEQDISWECSTMRVLCDSSHFVQDECALEPELYERAEKLFRVLLNYITEFLVWEENFDLSAELQPQYGLWYHIQWIDSYVKLSGWLLTVCFSILPDKKTMHTTVYCTTMSTTRTIMWSTPCSALWTVIRLKHRHTQLLLTRRYFWF